ncbi:TPA: diguanylate cyclase, partial [Candidatus Sumerlaeota bacterium]|nr:diguanylate cyclase [Candidatus Sumerlaeota bacterium]
MNMNRHTSWFTWLCFLIVCFLPSIVWAGPHVRVGVYQNSPKVSVSAQGRPEGILIDLIEAIGAEEGWTIEYVPGTWGEGLDRLAAGKIDLMTDVAYTPERETLYRFHREPALSDWSEVYAQRGSKIRSNFTS